MKLSTSTIAAIGAAAILAAAVAWFFASGSSACSNREQVEARVSLVASQLQQAASQGKLKLEELAAGIKQMNDAATAYETTKDAQAYCEALDKLNVPALD
jgi:hypothetical protein